MTSRAFGVRVLKLKVGQVVEREERLEKNSELARNLEFGGRFGFLVTVYVNLYVRTFGIYILFVFVYFGTGSVFVVQKQYHL